MASFPEFPAGFTPEYLTQVLHEHGCLPNAGAVSSVTRQSVGDGTGMMADLARLVLEYSGDQGGAPQTLIAKFSSANETNRGTANIFHLPERETRFALELDPLTTAVTPQTYCVKLDGEFFLIMMEDLGDYDVGSQEVGATLAQTESAIDELAKLHSTFWEKVEAYPWVPGIADSYHADAMRQGTEAGWDNMVNLFGVPDTIHQYRDRFIQSVPDLQAERMTAPITLVHGDFRMENLLYGTQPQHHEVVIIDWQGPLKARGMFDVALFLGQSTKSDIREQHERALLERYLEGLRTGGVGDIDMAFLWDDYLRCTLYDWVYTAVVAGTLDASNEVAFRWMSEMVKRQTEVSLQHDVFRFLPD